MRNYWVLDTFLISSLRILYDDHIHLFPQAVPRSSSSSFPCTLLYSLFYALFYKPIKSNLWIYSSCSFSVVGLQREVSLMMIERYTSL